MVPNFLGHPVHGIQKMRNVSIQLKTTASVSSDIVKPNTHRRLDSTVELSRVGGVNAPVGSRDAVYNFMFC